MWVNRIVIASQFSPKHRHLFPSLPERTRQFRLFNSHHHLIDLFVTIPSLIGVIDTNSIELINPDGKAEVRSRLAKKGFQISDGLWGKALLASQSSRSGS